MPHLRKTLEVICPQCKYHYWLEVFETPVVERCPICGRAGEFEEFYVLPKEENRN
uniref:Uncharacterized protein n=1 Tax=viral metagenome TaxID=1070528 RepID=A0A6M3KXT9_9ZZZZ